MLFVAKEVCPFCQGGSVGFLICSDHETMVLVCDECESTWLDPTHISITNVLFPKPPEFKVPGLDCFLKMPEAYWASKEEIVERGWGSFIVGKYGTLQEV